MTTRSRPCAVLWLWRAVKRYGLHMDSFFRGVALWDDYRAVAPQGPPSLLELGTVIFIASKLEEAEGGLLAREVIAICRHRVSVTELKVTECTILTRLRWKIGYVLPCTAKNELTAVLLALFYGVPRTKKRALLDGLRVERRMSRRLQVRALHSMRTRACRADTENEAARRLLEHYR